MLLLSSKLISDDTKEDHKFDAVTPTKLEEQDVDFKAYWKGMKHLFASWEKKMIKVAQKRRYKYKSSSLAVKSSRLTFVPVRICGALGCARKYG